MVRQALARLSPRLVDAGLDTVRARTDHLGYVCFSPMIASPRPGERSSCPGRFKAMQLVDNFSRASARRDDIAHAIVIGLVVRARVGQTAGRTGLLTHRSSSSEA